MPDRIKRVVEMTGVTEKEAEKACLAGDEKRASYYNYYSAKTWGAATSYDFCINSSALGIDATTKIIEDFIQQKLKL